MAISTDSRGLRAPDQYETLASTWEHITNLRSDLAAAMPAGQLLSVNLAATVGGIAGAGVPITGWSGLTFDIPTRRLIMLSVVASITADAVGHQMTLQFGFPATTLGLESPPVGVIGTPGRLTVSGSRLYQLAAGTYTVGATATRHTGSGNGSVRSGSALQVFDLGRLPS